MRIPVRNLRYALRKPRIFLAKAFFQIIEMCDAPKFGCKIHLTRHFLTGYKKKVIQMKEPICFHDSCFICLDTGI